MVETSMTRQLKKLIDKAKIEIAKSPILGLSFKTRQGILRELGPVPEEGTLGPGLIRRAHLCCEVVKPALPSWEAHYKSKDPRKMIRLAERYVSGKGGRDAGHNLKWNACFGEGCYLLGGAPEDERVAAFEPDNGEVCAGVIHHQRTMKSLSLMKMPDSPDGIWRIHRILTTGTALSG